MTSIHNSSAMTAAVALADSINASGVTLPQCLVSLTPRVVESEGELQAAFYAVPTALTNERIARTVIERDVTVSLVLLVPISDDSEVLIFLAELQSVSDCVMALGKSDDNAVRFVKWDCDELYDQELLAEQRILRSQINFSCKVIDNLT